MLWRFIFSSFIKITIRSHRKLKRAEKRIFSRALDLQCSACDFKCEMVKRQEAAPKRPIDAGAKETSAQEAVNLPVSTFTHISLFPMQYLFLNATFFMSMLN